MWVALVPSGMDWLDAEIGGVPAAGVVAALGQAGSGKTSLALGFAIAQLKRNQRVCYLTSETPEAVLEIARGMLELDLRQYIASGALSLLSFAPFFVNKVRSLNSVDPPLAELKEYFDEKRIDNIVFDTLDPMLGWIDQANAKGSVRHMLGQIQSWSRAVLCTMSGTAPAVGEFARLVSGSLELAEGKMIVRQAGWCNVYDIEAPLQFVQGRGLIVRKDAGRQPAKKAAYMSDMSLVAASPMLPDSERRPNAGGGGGGSGSNSPPPPGAGHQPVQHAPWMSLIGDANKILGPQAVILASADLFQTPNMNAANPNNPLVQQQKTAPPPGQPSQPPPQPHASQPPQNIQHTRQGHGSLPPQQPQQPHPSNYPASGSGSHASLVTGPHPLPALATGPHPQAQVIPTPSQMKAFPAPAGIPQGSNGNNNHLPKASPSQPAQAYPYPSQLTGPPPPTAAHGQRPSTSPINRPQLPPQQPQPAPDSDPHNDPVTRIAQSPSQSQSQSVNVPRDVARDLRATVDASQRQLDPNPLDWSAAATNKYQAERAAAGNKRPADPSMAATTAYQKRPVVNPDLLKTVPRSQPPPNNKAADDDIPASAKTLVTPPREEQGDAALVNEDPTNVLVNEDPTNVIPGGSQVPLGGGGPPKPRPAAGVPAGGPPRPTGGYNNNNNRRR